MVCRLPVPGSHLRLPVSQRSSAPEWGQAFSRPSTVSGALSLSSDTWSQEACASQRRKRATIPRATPLPTVPQSIRVRDVPRTSKNQGSQPPAQCPPVTYPPLRELAERLRAIVHIPDCRPHEVSLEFVSSFLFRAHSGHELLPVSCDLAEEGPDPGPVQPGSPGHTQHRHPITFWAQGVLTILVSGNFCKH